VYLVDRTNPKGVLADVKTITKKIGFYLLILICLIFSIESIFAIYLHGYDAMNETYLPPVLMAGRPLVRLLGAAGYLFLVFQATTSLVKWIRGVAFYVNIILLLSIWGGFTILMEIITGSYQTQILYDQVAIVSGSIAILLGMPLYEKFIIQKGRLIKNLYFSILALACVGVTTLSLMKTLCTEQIFFLRELTINGYVNGIENMIEDQLSSARKMCLLGSDNLKAIEATVNADKLHIKEAKQKYIETNLKRAQEQRDLLAKQKAALLDREFEKVFPQINSCMAEYNTLKELIQKDETYLNNLEYLERLAQNNWFYLYDNHNFNGFFCWLKRPPLADSPHPFAAKLAKDVYVFVRQVEPTPYRTGKAILLVEHENVYTKDPKSSFELVGRLVPLTKEQVHAQLANVNGPKEPSSVTLKLYEEWRSKELLNLRRQLAVLSSFDPFADGTQILLQIELKLKNLEKLDPSAKDLSQLKYNYSLLAPEPRQKKLTELQNKIQDKVTFESAVKTDSDLKFKIFNDGLVRDWAYEKFYPAPIEKESDDDSVEFSKEERISLFNNSQEVSDIILGDKNKKFKIKVTASVGPFEAAGQDLRLRSTPNSWLIYYNNPEATFTFSIDKKRRTAKFLSKLPPSIHQFTLYNNSPAATVDFGTRVQPAGIGRYYLVQGGLNAKDTTGVRIFEYTDNGLKSLGCYEVEWNLAHYHIDKHWMLKESSGGFQLTDVLTKSILPLKGFTVKEPIWGKVKFVCDSKKN
jgi:hypothetical protein